MTKTMPDFLTLSQRSAWRWATGLAGLLAIGVIALLLIALPARAADGVVVIGHPSLPRMEPPQVQRLYTGRAVELAGQAVTVVNAPAGSSLRQRFLQQYLQQDDDQYRAYWTVRRHIGKGAPPRELATSGELIQFVQSTPGAIGYIDASDLKAGMNVLTR